MRPVEVAVSFNLPQELVAQIAAVAPGVRARVLPRGTFDDPESIRKELADVEVLFARWALPWDRVGDLHQTAPRLRWVQLTSAGVDSVLPVLTDGITFTSAAGINAVPIAECVIAYMLMFTKGWPQLFRNQHAHAYTRFMPGEMGGKTVGIVGLGHIGEETAKRARVLGCRLLATRRSCTVRGPHELVDEVLPASDLGDMLAESDFVVVAPALTPETRGMINAERLRQMKPSAYLINVSRGEVVDEPALIEALRTGVIAGAALDVTVEEPLPPESPLWNLENVILTPHISGAGAHHFELGTALLCDNLRRYLAGEPLVNAVDAARGY